MTDFAYLRGLRIGANVVSDGEAGNYEYVLKKRDYVYQQIPQCVEWE
ncbi:MAG: hypothetical protein JWN76_700 [Chitinophagaceae bacterium]|nr:hypothetical protein [Chitinophagaceae bacterium]